MVQYNIFHLLQIFLNCVRYCRVPVKLRLNNTMSENRNDGNCTVSQNKESIET